MTGIVERDERDAAAGRVRLNININDRLVSFRPNPANRKPGQSTEQFEAAWYAYWTPLVGKEVSFVTNRNSVIVAAQIT